MDWRIGGIGAINKEQSERYKFLCNDKQFSDHDRRGACAWHQGLAEPKVAPKAKPQKVEPKAKPQPIPKAEIEIPVKWDLSFVPYPSRGGKYSENEYKKLNSVFITKNDPNLKNILERAKSIDNKYQYKYKKYDTCYQMNYGSHFYHYAADSNFLEYYYVKKFFETKSNRTYDNVVDRYLNFLNAFYKNFTAYLGNAEELAKANNYEEFYAIWKTQKENAMSESQMADFLACIFSYEYLARSNWYPIWEYRMKLREGKTTLTEIERIEKSKNKVSGLYEAPKGITNVIKSDYVTQDIIDLILYADKEAKKERGLQKIATLLRGPDELETCRKIWHYVKKHVKYIRDTTHEDVKSPRATLKSGFGDCKSMSILVSNLLFENGINCYFRFTGYRHNDTVTHVYIVTASGIIIDCVHTAFNQEVAYTKKIDYKNSINGIEAYKRDRAGFNASKGIV
jgi:hypothetical protein